ncbi:MAG: OmpA family protein [Firmicutes bacterium]|nr:OmpA family protein [Bacillota bacterium]
MMDDDEHEGGGHEGGGMLRWLITYADLITLLLAFFIVLYAMNRTEQIKFSLVAQALANEFDSRSIVGQGLGPSIITANSGTETARATTQELQSLSKLQSELQTAIDQAGLANQVSVTSNERGVEVSLNSTLLFAPASAHLSPSAIALLERLGRVLATVPNDIEVVGYTDSTPIRTAEYPSNWQLSAMRAANVVYVLSRVPGIHPARLSLAGFGKYHPIATNATPEGRAQNRRVNILVLRSAVAEVAIGNGP